MNRIYYILSVVLLFTACTKETPDVPAKPLPPAGMAEVALGEIRLSDADAAFGPEASSTTRATAGNLPAGSTLRLYAFKKGEKGFDNKLLTRTYTVNASGAAILDAGQEPLYLPTGEADIYLAGPVARNIATADSPIWEDVAGEAGIYPFQGVDLIAGYAAATINAGAVNALPAMTLVHKMAKVQVVVSRHESAAYENLVVKEIKLYSQSQTGTYTLDATGGVIAPGAKADFSYPQIAQETLNEKYSGTALLIPQPTSNLKIETSFECNQMGVDGDTHPTLRYRQSGVISTALTAGTATRFTAAPLTPVDIKWRVTLLPWDTVNQGTIVVPGLETLLPAVTSGLLACWDARTGLTGGDAKGNGAKWTDISGLTLTGTVPASGGIIYNEAIKAIVFTGPLYNNQGTRMNGTFDLGSFNTITIEAVYQSINGYLNYLFETYNAAGERNIYMRPNTGASSVGFEFGSPITPYFYYTLWEAANAKGSVVVTIDGQGGTMAFYRNGSVLSNNTLTPTTDKVALANFVVANTKNGNQAFSGNIHALRIYGRSLTAAEVKTNYNQDKVTFELP